MRRVDPDLRLVAVGRGPRDGEGLAGAGAGDPETGTNAWTDEVLRQAGGHVDYLSIHLYGASRHRFTSRTGDDEFETTVGQARYFEAELRAYADLRGRDAGRLGLRRPLALALDEWNMRHLEPAAWPLPRPATTAGWPRGTCRRPAAPAGCGSTAGARARPPTPCSTPASSTPCSAWPGTPSPSAWPTRST